jgi:hypothetical protein
VRNYFETRRWTWSDVEDFRLAIELTRTAVHVVLRHGGELFPLDATRRLWPSQRDDAKLQRRVADLQAWTKLSPHSATQRANYTEETDR